jgi:Ca2+-transporting ATPase
MNHDMARSGFRVIAYAVKTVNRAEAKPYEKLALLGLAGLIDPPRQDARMAVQECQDAGIRVVMVTGDQAVTAENIGKAVGIRSPGNIGVIHEKDILPLNRMSRDDRKRMLLASLFARVSPKQKLDLIELHQKNGSIVAMTGDGVNDAPALKKADIGVAMGLRGTQVARDAADMVLKDDAFSTIIAAVAQGRVIFNNIRKCVFFLISCNISEVASVGLAAIINRPLPILPLQILFINLVTDVFPALALGAGIGDPDVMKRPPRPAKESIMTRHYWLASAAYGLIITLSVLGALEIALLVLHMEYSQAVTISFLTLAVSQLFHVFNMRDYGSRFFKNDITQNPYIWGGLALCAGMLALAVHWPVLAVVLKVKDPGPMGWLVVMSMSLVVFVVGQIVRSVSPKSWN